jgi:D-alanyl-D-alanine carboxypeptidase/D-alanyl-D-alanine-endopeptidase (penicillin-binding protein 4)
MLGADQGVYVETADGTVLVSQEAARAVHPASVSKVPTTLALLRKLGPAHRFVTTFSAAGRIVGGTLVGDLVVDAGGDPALVDEDALLIADRLKEMGLTRVAGDLRVRGSLTFDWQSDANGMALRRALAGQVSPGALAAVRAYQLEHPGAAVPQVASLMAQGLQFAPGHVGQEVLYAGTGGDPAGAERDGSSADAGGAGDPAKVVSPGPARTLVIHRSQPLLSLVKSLNDYSNNIFKPLADEAGGPGAVESLARIVVPGELRGEIVLGDGAGTDPTNRLSPRVTVRLLRVLDEELQASGHALYEILPVAGIDDGTLRHRLDEPEFAGHVIGKTGTFGDYGASALVGAISTRDRGTVYFAILDHGVPVPEARRRQDRFVRALLTHLHSRPWSYQRDPRPAIAKAEIVAAP